MTSLKQVTSDGWDKTAETLAKFILKPTIGFSTYFAIDALNLSISKEENEKPMTILDVACGTGPLSLFGTEVYKNSKFIATDFSPKMIEVLDRLIKENNIKNIETHVMDGQNLSIENDSIDYTFSIFGLIFFPDLTKGMKEMYRVLKPNNKSRVAIASWCKDSFLVQIFQETIDQLLTEQNGKPTTFYQRALSLSNEFEFKTHLESVGFIDVSITKVEHPMEINEIVDLIPMFKTNPTYIDCIDQLNTEELKLKFDQLFIEIAKSKNPTRSLENNKLQLRSFSFIGIGTK
ncbi:hypothetical protein RB653_001126 [Dictyostelium firmibasis]|uniref:Methyltransferase domain-containing protein n=1 Tax=Dictyostelium firmibasis TaxID=79012 RepID=A0AAN7U6W8_9MYCE